MKRIFELVKKELFDFHSLAELSDDELYRLINSVVIKQNTDKYLSVNERITIVDKIFSSIRGLGVLDELLQDDSISEIMINRFDEIFIDRGGTLIRSEIVFDDEKSLEDIIQRIVSKSGREVNTANPIADTRLPGGERVNIVLPPISIGSPTVTIRRFPKERIRMKDLIELGTISKDAAEFLEQLVERKFNIFISGGTSSGKTTFLNALSDFIPSDERVITIEDSAELQITRIKNLIRLEARNSNTTGSGEISIRDLIRASLRMRPDRIIVGEVRGEEAIDMLGAMNTGHDGSLSTGHANSSHDMLYRLETMIMQGDMSFPIPAVRQYISSSIDVIVHLCKMADSKRRVVEISEVAGIKGGQIVLNPIYVFSEGMLKPTGKNLKHAEKLSIYMPLVQKKEEIKKATSRAEVSRN